MALAFAGVSFLSSLATGQEPAVKRDTVTLPSISVSAARHAESPFLVPFAFTRLGPGQLKGTRGLGLDEALSKVPGVLVQSRYGGTDVRLVIRGYGARGAGDRSNAGTSRGVRILLDGFPETEPDGRTAMDAIDLATASSIEVIRSNASSLFGNAAGGVVNISTLSRFDQAFGEAEVAMGGFGLKRYIGRAGSTWGVDGDSRVLGTVIRSTFDGWRAHSDASRTLVNGALSAAISDRTTAGIFAVATSNQFRIPGPLTQAQVEDDPSQANATYATRDERRFNRVGRLGFTVEQRVGQKVGDDGVNGSISASGYINPKFLQRSERGTFRDFTRYHVGGNLILRGSAPLGGSVRGNVLAGADEAYQDGAILFYSLTSQGTRGTELRDNKREGANNLGVFAHGEVMFGERWSGSVGARYDRVTYYAQSFITPKLDDERVFSKLTPKVGINFRLAPTHSIYANVGGGVEVPAGNETDPASTFGQDTVTALNPLLDPIVSRTYELGTKHVFIARSGFLSDVSYDVAAYHTRVRNDIVPYRGGRFYFTAGRTRRTGLELGANAQARNGISLGGTVTWSRNRYAEYVVDSVHYGKPGALADYGGNQMVGLPSLMYSVTMGFQPAAWHGVRVSATAQGAGKYFVDDANAVSVPSHAIFSASATLNDPIVVARSVTLRGYVTVNNLFDRRYVGSAFLNPDVVGGVPVAFEPGLPRSFVVGAALGWR